MKKSRIFPCTFFLLINKQNSSVGKIRHLVQSKILLFSGGFFVSTAREWLLGERKGSWEH